MNSKKKKPLLMIFPMEIAAHYLRCLELSKRLRSEFQIKIANSLKYDYFIKTSGFETFKVENFNSKTISEAVHRFDFSWINCDNLEGILVSQTEAIQEHRPDFVLGDVSLTLKMASELCKTKFVSLLNGYLTKYYRCTRKVSRTHPGYQYSKKIHPSIFDILTKSLEYRALRKIHEPFRILRKKLNMPLTHYFLDELEGNFNLICDLPKLFPQKNLPSNYSYIGPLFYNAIEKEEEIIDFIREHRPNVLVSMGSTGNNDKLDFLNDSLFDDFIIIISGDNSSTSLRSNVISKPFLNHMAVMNKMDIVICHGGNGTIYQALAHELPVLCITHNLEQEWNVQRIEELKLGSFLNDHSDSQNIRKLIDHWIGLKASGKLNSYKDEIEAFLNNPISLSKIIHMHSVVS